MTKTISILGSTGSIGKQALDVISQHSDLLTAEVLTANNQADELIAQAIKFCEKAISVSAFEEAKVFPKQFLEYLQAIPQK